MRIKVIALLVIIVILTLNIIVDVDYDTTNRYYYYSELSIKNGINISRWYGDLKNVDDWITKLLFNKILFIPFYIAKYLTAIFQFIVNTLI